MRDVITRADLADVAKTVLLGGPVAAWAIMLVLGAVYLELGFFRPVGYWPILVGCLLVAAISVPFDLRTRYMNRTGSRY
jgi:hypothetical protein